MTNDAEQGDRPWRQIHPPAWAPPKGYSNGVASEGGRHVAIAGQVAFDESARIVHLGDLPAQAAKAFENLKTVLECAGGRPEHLVRMRIYVLDTKAWKAAAKPIGRAYRACFGTWFPAMTLVQVAGLYDDGALVEVEAEAVVPLGVR